MKLVRSFTLVAAVFAFLAMPLAAQDNMRFVSGQPYGAVEAWGVLVGPYRGALIAEPGSPTIDMYCVDWFHNVWNGAEWDASFTNMASSNFGATRMMTDFGLGMTDAVERYQIAAWLSTQMTLDNTSEWGAIHGTIWNVMSGGTASTGGTPLPADDQWYAQALANSDEINLSEWTVITDTDGARQEFITREVVPEPETVLLFGTGLLVIGLIAYFRRGVV